MRNVDPDILGSYRLRTEKTGKLKEKLRKTQKSPQVVLCFPICSQFFSLGPKPTEKHCAQEVKKLGDKAGAYDEDGAVRNVQKFSSKDANARGHVYFSFVARKV